MSTTDIRVHSGIGIDLNTHALLFLSLTSDNTCNRCGSNNIFGLTLGWYYCGNCGKNE
jgi:hypothetical protein